jgi:hypothetical protein
MGALPSWNRDGSGHHGNEWSNAVAEMPERRGNRSEPAEMG